MLRRGSAKEIAAAYAEGKRLILAHRAAGAFPVPAPAGRVWFLLAAWGEKPKAACLPFEELPLEAFPGMVAQIQRLVVALPPLLPVVVLLETALGMGVVMGACKGPLFVPPKKNHRLLELLTLCAEHGHFQAPPPTGRAWACIAVSEAAGFRADVNTVSRTELPHTLRSLQEEVATVPPHEVPIVAALADDEGGELGVFRGVTLTQWREGSASA